MRHFLKLAQGLDVLPLLYAITRQPQLWDAHPIRTTFPGSPHTQVSDILLRFQALPEGDYDVGKANAEHETVPYPAWWLLPEARPLVYHLMARVQATRLGRVMVTRLAPGCEIPPHIDSAPHSTYYERQHIILAAPPWDCAFVIEDEIVQMQPGECWWINNARMHGVVNHGDSDRLALIIDTHSDPAP